MKVGVFDSGVGGKSVVNAIKKARPDLQIIYAEDRANVPYGTKTPSQLLGLVLPILEKLSAQCDIIIIACNTVSTTLIDKLRDRLSVPLIAMEPMVKPAAGLTKTGVIAVCATPTTLASDRYQWLKTTYAEGVKVLEPDCSDWAYMVEANDVDHKKINRRTSEVCEQGADIIVLGCTHYHWIEMDIQKVANSYGSKVIQPEQSIVQRLNSVLKQLA